MTRVAILTALVSFGSFSPLAAQAPVGREPAADLADIREMILYARYDEAIQAALTFLDRTDLDARTRNLGLEVLATAHIANRDEGEAEPVLRELFTRDPGHRLSDGDASPLVQAAFQRAREAAPPPVTVRLEHRPPEPTRHESPRVEARITAGLDAIAEVRLHYRTEGAPRFATLVMDVDPATGVASARLPLLGAPDAAQTLEYYLVTVAPSLTELSGLASPANPLAIRVPARTAGASSGPLEAGGDDEGGGGVASKWWFWTILVAVVAGAAVGTYFLLQDDPPSGSLGHVTLQ